jgi:hypothetical protein
VLSVLPVMLSVVPSMIPKIVDLAAVRSSCVRSCSDPNDRYRDTGIGAGPDTGIDSCLIGKIDSVSVSASTGSARGFGLEFAGVFTKRPVRGSLILPLLLFGMEGRIRTCWVQGRYYKSLIEVLLGLIPFICEESGAAFWVGRGEV